MDPYNQIRLSTNNCVGLSADPPNAQEPDGLANDRESLMLPTLYIYKGNGGYYAKETQYTDKYLRGVSLTVST